MRALKVLVAVLGVFIIAGFIFVATEIYYRMTIPGYRESREATPPVETLRTLIPVGTNARIRELQVVGNRVVLVVGTEDGGDHLFIVDPNRGAVVAGVDFGPARSATTTAESAPRPVPVPNAAPAAEPGRP